MMQVGGVAEDTFEKLCRLVMGNVAMSVYSQLISDLGLDSFTLCTYAGRPFQQADERIRRY